MIPQAYIAHWRNIAPWPSDAQVEQDLVISRALVEIFNHEFLKDQLAFRGGTALHKLYLGDNSRYSEDIDLVLTQSQKYGEIIGALREILTPWLGKPRFDQKEERLTLHFKFMTEIEPIQQMKLKVEINTSETFNVMGIVEKDFSFESPWFNGKTKIKTFTPEELLGTKFRALYQRDKGRDLFDLEVAHNILKLDTEKIINCFYEYTKKQGLNITRALFEEQLYNKKGSKKFLNDISPLLRPGHKYNMNSGFQLLANEYIPRLQGDPWKDINQEE